VGASQRTSLDPNPAPTPIGVGITADGSEVLFVSSSELTNDANTGTTAGVSTDAGRDLYRYDMDSGLLTDLTVDTTTADAARGANVQLDQNGAPFVFSTTDGSYIYFTATGVLAAGAEAGHTSLYVLHDDHISFVAPADGIPTAGSGLPLYVTPSGKHIAFASTESLTGYDNNDSVTGQPHLEVFKFTFGGGVECTSCRNDRTKPTGDASLPEGINGRTRVMSDDGRRVFFHSTDMVVPQASSGLQQLFEYANGQASAISRLDGPAASIRTRSATFLDASATGDDVFFETYSELVANPNGGDDAVYDARVNGGFPVATPQRCIEVACQESPTPAPALPTIASLTFLDDGNGLRTAEQSPVKPQIVVSKVKAIAGTAGSLKVKVPGAGRLTVSGSHLLTKRTSPSKAQTVAVRLVLSARGRDMLRQRRTLKTKVTVSFTIKGGQSSSATLSVTFIAGAARKGR
jgi:hypothetical protein